ncbi:MAG: phenylalanine--tRNA ligase subunit beta, partial [Candidatus Woesearchaeota archaeon]
TSKNLIAMKTLTKDEEIIEIENPMSESYSVVRNWIIPILLEFVGKNKHAEFPQKIFEEGIITVKGEQPKDYESLACVSCHKLADFTELKQTLEAVLRSLGIFCDIEEFEHPSFIPGRCGRVIVGGEDIGIIGEIAPEVLVNFEILFPVSAFEMNITKLFKHTNYND